MQNKAYMNIGKQVNNDKNSRKAIDHNKAFQIVYFHFNISLKISMKQSSRKKRNR